MIFTLTATNPTPIGPTEHFHKKQNVTFLREPILIQAFLLFYSGWRQPYLSYYGLLSCELVLLKTCFFKVQYCPKHSILFIIYRRENKSKQRTRDIYLMGLGHAFL